MREWASQQLARLEKIAAKTEITLIDRQLIEAFSQRIEVDSNSNTGTIVVCADLEAAFASTQVVGILAPGDRARWDGATTRCRESQHKRDAVYSSSSIGAPGSRAAMGRPA